MKWGVVRFPGSLDDGDALYALRDVMGQDAALLWHKDESLGGAQCVVLPGGFSYGDYLRCGAIARFSPVMEAVINFAEAGRPVIGICNGFQVLCESGLLPGALIRNASLQFRCEWAYLRREGGRTPWAEGIDDGELLHLPISHGEGNYQADAETLAILEAEGRVVFRYCDEHGGITRDSNPNGSLNNIAGIINIRGNVLGMMPHPERAPEQILGGADGNRIWQSIIASTLEAVS
jgi:phosphoribosylformylglycinamidine synthase